MRQAITIATGAAWLAAAASAGQIEFLDQTFDPASYTVVFTESQNGQTASQEPDGGNSGTTPDPFRRVNTIVNPTTYAAHLHESFVIDPAAVQVETLHCSVDARALAAFGQGMAYGFAAMQDGQVFRIGGTITGSSGTSFQWNTHAIERTPDMLPGLDFSPSGSPIQFGFFTGNSGGAGISVGYDNLRITITTAACPEDLDGDGVVGFSDLNLVLADFNTTGAGLPGDVDGDGDVDFDDLNLVVSVFNTAC